MAKTIDNTDSGRIKEYGILAHCYRHKLLEGELTTTEGEKVEIIDPGLLNRNAGPDFFNAKIRLGRKLFVGSVAVMGSSSEWNRYRLGENNHYQSTILVVCLSHDDTVRDQKGNSVPVLVTCVPDHIRQNYQILLTDRGCDLCRRNAGVNVSRLIKHSWLAALEAEWLDKKTTMMKALAGKNGWEHVLATGMKTETLASKNQQKDFMRDISRAEGIGNIRSTIGSYLSVLNIRHNGKSVENIMVNTVAPWLFAYGQWNGKDNLCDKAFDILTESSTVNTRLNGEWKEADLNITTGGDCMAIEHLKQEYCSRKRCLQCRFGYEFLKNRRVSAKADAAVSREAVQLALCFC